MLNLDKHNLSAETDLSFYSLPYFRPRQSFLHIFILLYSLFAASFVKMPHARGRRLLIQHYQK